MFEWAMTDRQLFPVANTRRANYNRRSLIWQETIRSRIRAEGTNTQTKRRGRFENKKRTNRNQPFFSLFRVCILFSNIKQSALWPFVYRRYSSDVFWCIDRIWERLFRDFEGGLVGQEESSAALNSILCADGGISGRRRPSERMNNNKYNSM